jgi:hypothetical protein
MDFALKGNAVKDFLAESGVSEKDRIWQKSQSSSKTN